MGSQYPNWFSNKSLPSQYDVIMMLLAYCQSCMLKRKMKSIGQLMKCFHTHKKRLKIYIYYFSMGSICVLDPRP